MAITFYTLNGILIDRSNENLYGILNLFPRSNRTLYVPGKAWHAKHSFLPQRPARKQRPETLDFAFWITTVSGIRKEKLPHTRHEITKSTEKNKIVPLLINEIKKMNNINKYPKIIRNHSKNFISNRSQIDSDIIHSQNLLHTSITNSVNQSDLPLFYNLEHQSYIRKLLVRGHPVLSIDCRKLINGDLKEINKAKTQTKQKEQPLSTRYYDIQTQNCETFQRRFGYITSPLTEEERDFPLAYSILMYKDVEQVERLLRTIYRPQNSYCIHIDAKTKPAIRNSMKNIVKCFPNIFITSRSVDVRWGEFSVLEPELICMQELWKHKKWKYFINLTGQEFPLKTNYELVQILTAYNGANDLEGTIKRANTERWKTAGRAPHNIRPTKGAVHVIVQRGFVDYILHSSVAKDFLRWVKKIDVPDETFFSSLNHNSHLKVPGSYLGVPETGPLKPFLARYKLWVFENSPFHGKCYGKWVHSICIFGVQDLQELVKRKELFANKFHDNYQPLAQKCLTEWLFNKTRDYFFKWKTFNATFYKELDFVKHKV